jgi:hypothetical protein
VPGGIADPEMAMEGRRFHAEGEMAKSEWADDARVELENKTNENVDQTLIIFF